MSDGPHRSLNIRRGWKRLAECAGNTAFDDGERREALAAALEADWRAEVPDGLVRRMRRILDDPQESLFRDSTIAQLEQSRDEAAGHPLAGALLDCTIHVVDQGYCGKAALEKATCDALQERAASGQRQVEEHWMRTSTPQRAGGVSDRIAAAIAESDMTEIGRRCMKRDGTEALQAPLKKTGIDDGVSLL